MSLTYGSLFAGYGGLEMGIRSVLPGDLSWYAEFDKAPSSIMAHHHPDVPNLGDVTKVDWASVPKVDVITGGSPCQDLSHAGKRKGMTDGTRSNLWSEMREAIAVIRPRLVVWENVRGALSAPATSDVEREPGLLGVRRDGPALRAIGRVVGDLASLGYVGRWYGLRAADVGAAHGRFRVFIFAAPSDAGGIGGPEALEYDGRGATATHGAGLPHEPDRDALRTGPDRGLTPHCAVCGCSDDLHDSDGFCAGPCGGNDFDCGGRDTLRSPRVGAGLTLLPTPAVNDMGAAYTPETWDAWTDRMKAEHGNGNGHGKSLSIEAQRLLPTPRTSDTNGAGSHGDGGMDLRTVAALLPTPRATRGGSGTETRDLLLPTPRAQHGEPRNQNVWERPADQPQNLENALAHVGHVEQDWREYEAAIRRAEHALGRPAPDPTEPGAKGQPRLSPRFVEWMMMLPEGHVTEVPGLSRNDQLKALGNGVLPPQAAAACRAFLADSAREDGAA